MNKEEKRLREAQKRVVSNLMQPDALRALKDEYADREAILREVGADKITYPSVPLPKRVYGEKSI